MIRVLSGALRQLTTTTSQEFRPLAALLDPASPTGAVRPAYQSACAARTSGSRRCRWPSCRTSARLSPSAGLFAADVASPISRLGQRLATSISSSFAPGFSVPSMCNPPRCGPDHTQVTAVEPDAGDVSYHAEIQIDGRCAILRLHLKCRSVRRHARVVADAIFRPFAPILQLLETQFTARAIVWIEPRRIEGQLPRP